MAHDVMAMRGVGEGYETPLFKGEGLQIKKLMEFQSSMIDNAFVTSFQENLESELKRIERKSAGYKIDESGTGSRDMRFKKLVRPYTSVSYDRVFDMTVEDMEEDMSARFLASVKKNGIKVYSDWIKRHEIDSSDISSGEGSDCDSDWVTESDIDSFTASGGVSDSSSGRLYDAVESVTDNGRDFITNDLGRNGDDFLAVSRNTDYSETYMHSDTDNETIMQSTSVYDIEIISDIFSSMLAENFLSNLILNPPTTVLHGYDAPVSFEGKTSVYILILQNKLNVSKLYVGETESIRQRLEEHR